MQESLKGYCVTQIIIFSICLQILIIEFSGKAFHVTGLGWEEWLWCVFLGFSELVWGQLVLTIPKTSFPKLCRFGTKELPLATIVEPDGAKDSKARLLWIRGLTRLQHQVCYWSKISYFRPDGHNFRWHLTNSIKVKEFKIIQYHSKLFVNLLFTSLLMFIAANLLWWDENRNHAIDKQNSPKSWQTVIW